MTTLDAKGLEAARAEFDKFVGGWGAHAAVHHAVLAYLESLPPQPVEVTEEMVRVAERAYVTVGNDMARPMRKALEAALIVPQEAVKE